MKNRILLFALILSCLFGCDKAEQIPGYIRVEPFTVNEPGGAAIHDFTEAWVFVDNKFFGAYPIGGEFPVLTEGTTLVEVAPGIAENGIQNTPNLYPMMSKYKTTVDIIPGETVTINPSTAYDPESISPIGGTESFEGGNIIPFKDIDVDTTTFLEITDVDGQFGSYLRLEVDEDHDRNGIAMSQMLEDIPVTGGKEVWLEIHYKNDVPFNLFLVGANKSNPALEFPQTVFSFNNSEIWNKTYFNITPFVVGEIYDLYGIGFSAFLGKDGNGNYTSTNGSVCIDNIKVIHF